MKWYFSPQLPGQVETEVTQRGQFSNDEVDISETIVREAVQNSLDAAVDDRCRVTFRWLDKSDGLEGGFMKNLFLEQLEHAKKAGLDVGIIDFNEPRALVIEDFGTRGLTGSVNTVDKDNFSDFWRRHGKSHKTGKSRGRWGLGKLVYSTSSELGVFFGVTVRNSDPAIHVMGQTVLNLRTVDDRKYPPHAFFSDIEGRGDIYKELPVPLKDQDLVRQFVDQFSLERTENPGLSVVIPFPNRKFQLDHMIGVAIVNYFYPLITGQLVLKFDDTEINSENIRGLAHKYAADSFQDIDVLFDFIEEANATSEENLLTLKESWAKDSKLDEDDFAVADLESIREKFTGGELVGLKLPILLKKKNGEEKQSWFTVFIKRPDSLTRGLDLYVRGGLTLPGEAKFKERKALGAMIAEEYNICSFLGDAENAAHTKWVANAEKLGRYYQAPGPKLRVIKNALLELYDLLAEVTEEVDELALQSFFWADEPENGKKPGKKKMLPLVPSMPEPRPKDFTISATLGGFSIRSHKEANPVRFPQVINIRVAYDVAIGNPFKKYNSLDFKLGNKQSISLEMAKGCGKLISCKENQLKIEVLKLPFIFRASGFDEHRDLAVKLQKEA